MKGKNDGIQNEIEIVAALNEKQVKRLPEIHRKFLQEMSPELPDDTVVYAEKIGGQGYKPDVQIELNKKRWNVSVKTGSGNSVHQEKTEYFIHYCMRFLDMTEQEKNSLLLYLYGDGTTDGDSDAENRLKDEELSQVFESEIKDVQMFLNRNKRALIERFLVYGRQGKQKKIKADFLYHGDVNNGVWCPLDEDTISYLAEITVNNAQLSIGPLSFQVWNRNLQAKSNLEDRRHSIQIKWVSCKTNIISTNEYYLLQYKNKLQNQIRVQGDNKQGFENQNNLALLLDNQKVGKLDSALRAIIKEIYPTVSSNEIIQCYNLKGNYIKPRICISVGGKSVNLSVFMGKGNSVHQENISTFLPYCKDYLKMTGEEEIAFLELLYGDGTIDGKSEMETRLKDSQIRNRYATQVVLVQRFINENRKELVERFLVYGKSGKQKNIKSDYIYYGTEVTGRIISCEQVVDYIVKQENADSALLAVGSLTIQTWNRNLKKNPAYEYKRNSIQVKWGSIKTNLQSIRNELNINERGTIDGDWEEYELVSKLNRNRNITSKIWKNIVEELGLTEIIDIYAIKVSKTVYSMLAERNVLPKADVYLVKGKLAHDVLLNNNFWLDEDSVENLGLSFIAGTGISCKRPNSKSFTYAKLSKGTFIKLTGDSKLGAGISLFVTEKDVQCNANIASDWGTCEDELISNYNKILDEKNITLDDRRLTNVEVSMIIKHECIRRFTQLIHSNMHISNAIFNGIGVFEEPYSANFTFINGEIALSTIPKFTVTTGSGRHSRKYTIVIKP